MSEVLFILGSVVEKLSPFLIHEGELLGGLTHEVKLISDEFGLMKAFLQKLSNVDHDDPQLTEWIQKVTEVSYQTEDVLDEYMYHFPSHSCQGFRGSIRGTFESFKKLPARHHLASELEKLKARIKNISEIRLRYESPNASIHSQAQEIVASNNLWRNRKDDDAFLAEEAQLVGINQPIRDLIFQLIDTKHSVKVIAVVGMGGLGKTSVVKKVYDSADVKNHFRIRAWVTVSQVFDIHELLKDLIDQVVDQIKKPVPPKMDSLNTCSLKELLKEFLQQGRYIIVFDDVWDREFLNEFRLVLPQNNHGGNVVLLTTRNKDVACASDIGFQSYVHKMEFLNFEDSWTLFCRRTFRENYCPTHLNNVAKDIVKKCQGLPLAIVVIGGLLAAKDSRNVEEWERVHQRLGKEFQRGGQIDRVKRILSLSYDDLSYTLKSCLLYTSIYPEDHLIKCQDLVNLWIAERLVKPTERQTSEEVGWDYLRELGDRSLIQFNEVRYNGLYLDFRIHDFLRELLVSKSRDLNMLTILSDTGTSLLAGKMTRRLVFHSMDVAQMTSSLECHHTTNNVRSIINFGPAGSPSKAFLTKLLSYKLLTVVDLRGIGLEEFPNGVFKLFYLKFLAMSGAKIETIPKSIKKLQNLEFLCLEDVNVKELHKAIKKLHNLRHLILRQTPNNSSHDDFPFDGISAPDGLGDLLGLQSLQIIDVSNNKKTGILEGIGKLTKLRELLITKLRSEDGNKLCSSLDKLNNLESVVVSSHERHGANILDLNHPISRSSLQSLREFRLHGPLEKMPPWIRNLQRLERITLCSSNLEEDPLQTLQHLPNLFEVELVEAYKGKVLWFKSGCFVKLKTLLLKRMKGLRSLRIENNALADLKDLLLAELPSLEDVPAEFAILSGFFR